MWDIHPEKDGWHWSWALSTHGSAAGVAETFEEAAEALMAAECAMIGKPTYHVDYEQVYLALMDEGVDLSRPQADIFDI